MAARRVEARDEVHAEEYTRFVGVRGGDGTGAVAVCGDGAQALDRIVEGDEAADAKLVLLLDLQRSRVLFCSSLWRPCTRAYTALSLVRSAALPVAETNRTGMEGS
jgi:hypothetical protein